MKSFVLIQATLLAFTATITAARADVEKTEKLRTVKARSIELKVPDSWNSTPPASNMRAAQISIPGAGANKEGAELIVFYFGGPTGGIKANIDQWVGQFQVNDRRVEMVQGKCAAGSYILVDIAGTWKKPIGAPFARKSKITPNSRVVNIILVEEKGDTKDYYFLKMSGPDDLVKSKAQALRVAIGAEPDSEKPFSLGD